MDPGEIVGIIVGATVISAFIFRLLLGLHRLISIGEHLVERVTTLENSLGNGIRAEIRDGVAKATVAAQAATSAATQAAEARNLAAQAATAAATADQRAVETAAETQRAVNAMRAEVNAMTNVAMTDHENIWQTLAEAGLDRRRNDR